MSTRDHHDDAAFDAELRALHRTSLRQLSPATLAKLRAARASAQAAPAPRRWPWVTATAFSGLLALGLGLQFMTAPQGPGPQAAAASAGSGATENAGELLDENPDLYLWLASSEAQPLAME